VPVLLPRATHIESLTAVSVALAGIYIHAISPLYGMAIYRHIAIATISMNDTIITAIVPFRFILYFIYAKILKLVGLKSLILTIEEEWIF
jgi:hypothetical protein